MTLQLSDLARYLDTYLRIDDVPDDPRALNGLQVENSGATGSILGAVDASQAAIDAAASRGAKLLLVHHGLFWGGLERLTGRHGKRVRALVQHDVALYAAHLPLDCHPEVGNNFVLAQELGLTELIPFGAYQGMHVGVAGTFDGTVAALAARVQERLGKPHLLALGAERAGRVAVVTGAGSNYLAEARAAGCSTLLTGEAPHHVYFDAEEWRMNLILAGHYATETVGVQALGEHLSERFDLSFDFFHHPTGL